MGAGVHRPLYVERASRIHALAPETKIVAAFVFVVAVVATPREAFAAFGAYAVLLAGLTVVARIPVTDVVRRLAIELPFVAFAFLLPLIGTGPRTIVLGVPLSEAGLWGAWTILVKGTLGVAATGILVATTDVRELFAGLDRLHVPRAFTAIAGFMIRYAEVVTGELRRLRIARISRGDDPRWFWQARAVAATAGTMFIRSYERGERVYLAMVSRGYDGTMPADGEHAPRREWAVALALPGLAVLIAGVALWT